MIRMGYKVGEGEGGAESKQRNNSKHAPLPPSLRKGGKMISSTEGMSCCGNSGARGA